MAQTTTIHSFRKPGKMKPLTMDAADVTPSTLKALSHAGIQITSDYLHDVNTHYIKPYKGYGMDADPTPPLTAPSIGTPVQFLQAWLPGSVRIATAARRADMIVGQATIGAWEDEEVVQSLIGNAGNALPYADNANFEAANWNQNFVKRTVARFEIGFIINRLEEARAARVRVNSSEEKRYGVIRALEIIRNQIAFFGFNAALVGNTNQTFGILNDPNLLPYETLPTGGWDTATFNQIVNDILFLASTLQAQSGDLVDLQRTPLKLVVSTVSYQYLNKPNDISSVTVLEYLQKNYPSMEVVSAPEFTAAEASLNVVYLFAEEIDDTGTDDQRTWIQPVPTVFRALGIEQRAKGYAEDYSNATAGVMAKRPYAIVRATGS